MRMRAVAAGDFMIPDTGIRSARWVMRSLNGSLWATRDRYTTAQVRKFQLATPVRPIEGIAAHIVKSGTLSAADKYGLGLA